MLRHHPKRSDSSDSIVLSHNFDAPRLALCTEFSMPLAPRRGICPPRGHLPPEGAFAPRGGICPFRWHLPLEICFSHSREYKDLCWKCQKRRQFLIDKNLNIYPVWPLDFWRSSDIDGDRAGWALGSQNPIVPRFTRKLQKTNGMDVSITFALSPSWKMKDQRCNWW